MLAVPLAVAAPAAAATLAYLNGRLRIGYDLSLLTALIHHLRKTKQLEKEDKVNQFYTLEDHAKSKTSANHTFLVFEGKEWTYRETYETVLKYAAWLKTKYAIAPREVVALDFMNTAQLIFLWLAVWSLGATPSFLNYNLSGPPLLHCLKASTARIVFVEDEVESRFTDEVREKLASTAFRDGKGSIEIVSCRGVESQVAQLPGHRETDLSRNGPTFSDMAILIFTSGTTGLPKPAIVSWSKLHVGGSFGPKWMGMKQTDRFYTVSYCTVNWYKISDNITPNSVCPCITQLLPC